MSKSKLSTTNNEANNAQNAKVTQEKQASKSKVLSSPENYSPASSIYKAYSHGFFPVAHKILFNSICKALEGKNEGNVDFQSVLDDAHMHRSSALHIIKHMVNWNILQVSFNSSQAIGEKRKSWAFIRIIRNPETQEDLPKSA